MRLAMRRKKSSTKKICKTTSRMNLIDVFLLRWILSDCLICYSFRCAVSTLGSADQRVLGHTKHLVKSEF